ncbi:hypothetical protein [Salirhabdus salicampi]|uniref:hypothetical protein n=1 Tax=Salirhabdus salicampi TaxID=476102 RepID=UPI0020C30E43|nr:hypothetical protein [Salirhabdus salicampi]MCP8617316.1 hypothetical protein [Salirhabdus salicampi]
MPKVYILLTRTGTLLSQTIGLYTRAPYNHVSISMDKELTQLYSFGRRTPYNPVRAGFVKECVYSGTYSRFPDTTCALYCITVDDRQMKKVERIINHFKRNALHYRYNLIGLAGVAIGRPLDRRNAFFCSQFVATVLKSAGVDVWNKPPGLITPEDYRNNIQFTKVYEGTLLNYMQDHRMKEKQLILYKPIIKN